MLATQILARLPRQPFAVLCIGPHPKDLRDKGSVRAYKCIEFLFYSAQVTVAFELRCQILSSLITILYALLCNYLPGLRRRCAVIPRLFTVYVEDLCFTTCVR